MPVALEPVPPIAPLVVVAHDDPGTADALRYAVESAGWPVLVADPGVAGLDAAMAAGPSVALVGCASLADLPAGHAVPLVAVGDDDRPADVRAALAAGARSLLAWPDGAADLPGELTRVAATARPDPTGGLGGLIVAARSVQGGAGTTTVAVHLAAAWARWGPSPVLLLDLSGGLAFRLDLTGAPTWSSLFTTAGPSSDWAGSTGRRPAESAALATGSPTGDGLQVVDTLDFLDQRGFRDTGSVLGGGPTAAGGDQDPAGDEGPGGGAGREVGADGGLDLDAHTLAERLAEPWPGLSVLPLSGLVDGTCDPPPEPWAVRRVLEVATTAYRVVVVDLPAAQGPVVGAVLSLADALVAVGRCETAGVRGLHAALEAWTAAGHDPDTAGAVVTGVRPGAPLAPREVRVALGDRLWSLIPAATAELAAAAEDGVLLLDRHDLSAVQAMVTLANRVIPFAAVSA
jgi:cellulose biosynthesis protein BcsQ